MFLGIFKIVSAISEILNNLYKSKAICPIELVKLKWPLVWLFEPKYLLYRLLVQDKQIRK
jgi:hypothetical protein